MAEIPQIPTSTPNVSVAPLTQPGNELNIFFNQYQFNIIKMYRKIHRFLFKNGIFVLMGIMALVIVQVLSDQTIAKSQTLSSLTSTSLTLARNAWDKQLSQQGNQDLEVLIPYGESEMREGLLSTKSNLAIYQGIVLPRVFSILSEEPFLDLEKFTNKQTTSGDLVEVIDQLIFSPLLQTSNLSFQPSLALSKGIIEDFNLQCLQEQKLSSILCDKFLATFFEDGKFYNVGAYKDDMEVLLRIIKDKDPLCRLMYDTTLYHRMIYPAFNDLILQCSTAQIQQYRELANFIEVEQELSKSFISSTIYTNKSVNAYKLLSTQQILYKNLLAGVLNKTYISSYLDYAQNLINRNNGNDRYILPLYKDILYRMNNAVLLPRLEISDNKTLSRAETQQILDKINQLNKGNPALGTIGLEKQLTTAGLVQQREIWVITTTTKDIEELLKPILDLKNRLRIQSYQVSDERDTVTFNTEIFSSDITTTLGMNLRAKIVLYKDKSTLYVKNITILNEPDVHEFLQSYLANEKISFVQLLNVIDENIGLYHEEETGDSTKTLCEVIQTMSSKATLVNCNDHLVDMIQAGINYTFIIEDEVLVDVVISDPVLEEQIKAMLKNSLITINTTYSLIEDILDKKPAIAEDKYIEQKLIITERMKLYLNTTPTITVLEGPVFEITFTLGEFTLKGTYDVVTNVISRIYYVIPNINETLLIRNFSLPIDAADKENLAHLSNNPRAVLSVFNPMAFDRYEKLSQQQK